MRFKVDENLPSEARDLLIQAGHDAETVGDEQLGGRPDSDIAGICQAEARAIVTLDTDFANIRAYPPRDYHGLIVIRTDDQSKPAVLALLPRILTTLKAEQLTGRLWIVEPHQIRIRGEHG